MARHRTVGPKQFITVRRSVDRTADADSFGDAPIIATDNRQDAIQIVARVSWNRRHSSAGIPGRVETYHATAILWKKDLTGSAIGYEPKKEDLWQMLNGDLFVEDVQPTGALPIRLGRSKGGWAGWRITLTDRNPSQRAATSYDT